MQKKCNIKTYEYDYRLDAINIWNRRAKDNLINKMFKGSTIDR